MGARLFLALVVAVAAAVSANTAVYWHSPDLIKFGAFLAISLLSAGARVRVPGVTVPLPLSYLFVLLGLVELTASETILLACGVALVQCYWNQPRRPRAAFALLQVALMIVAAGTAERVYHSAWFEFSDVDTSMRLAIATLALFLINTAPIAAWTAITEREPLRRRVAVHLLLVAAALPGGSRDRQGGQQRRALRWAGKPCCSPARWSI